MIDNEGKYGIPNIKPFVLQNKLGIIDSDELKEVSSVIVLEKLYRLRKDFKNTFLVSGILTSNNIDIDGNIILDDNHLKNIHKYLFDDIYPFAGQYRETDVISKGRGQAPSNYVHIFMEHYRIEEEVKMNIFLMNDTVKNKQFNTKEEFASWLSTYFSSLIRIHPFPDGNGRTVKEFFTEFVEANQNNKNLNFPPVEIDWSKMNQEKSKNILYEEILNPNFLKEEFNKIIVFTDEKKYKR